MMPALQLKVYGLVLAIFELLTDHKSLGKNNTQQKKQAVLFVVGCYFFQKFYRKHSFQY